MVYAWLLLRRLIQVESFFGLITLKRDEIFRVGLRILEDDEYSGIAQVVSDRVVAELGSWSLRRFLHVRPADHRLAGQDATLERVLDSVLVRRRVSFLSGVDEIHREVDALPVHRRCMRNSTDSQKLYGAAAKNSYVFLLKAIK